MSNSSYRRLGHWKSNRLCSRSTEGGKGAVEDVLAPLVSSQAVVVCIVALLFQFNSQPENMARLDHQAPAGFPFASADSSPSLISNLAARG